jgi:hypothetical protein
MTPGQPLHLTHKPDKFKLILRKIRPMKPLLASVLALVLVFLPAAARAASDADVTLLKVQKVVIEETVITIVVAEAKTQITLIRDDYDPKYTGANWHGMPVNVVQVISNKATFTIKRPVEAAPGGVTADAWQESLKAAKDLQDGKEVGRIGYYAPDIVIKGNMIDSITGIGFLYPKR